jgi:hypothetical protein
MAEAEHVIRVSLSVAAKVSLTRPCATRDTSCMGSRAWSRYHSDRLENNRLYARGVQHVRGSGGLGGGEAESAERGGGGGRDEDFREGVHVHLLRIDVEPCGATNEENVAQARTPEN